MTTNVFFFFQAEDGIRDRSPSRGLGDVYKRQDQKDFSEDNLKKAGITRRYQNDDKVRCKEEIVEVIRDGKL